jgi:hypothetical protein
MIEFESEGIEELQNFIKSFVDDAMEVSKSAGSAHILSNLKSAIASEGDFTDRMNNMFAEKGLKDEDGAPIRVKSPIEALNEAVDENGRIKFKMTVEEDRWFRSNKLYGNDILRKLDIKYS